MTIERAEVILAKARSWQTFDGMTDVQLARKMETTQRDAGFAMAFFSLTYLKITVDYDWTFVATWGFFFGMIGLATYMMICSSRFSKVRQLFENAGPQNLRDLAQTVIKQDQTL